MVGTTQFSDLRKILIRKFQEMIWGVWKPYSGWFLIPETSVCMVEKIKEKKRSMLRKPYMEIGRIHCFFRGQKDEHLCDFLFPALYLQTLHLYLQRDKKRTHIWEQMQIISKIISMMEARNGMAGKDGGRGALALAHLFYNQSFLKYKFQSIFVHGKGSLAASVFKLGWVGKLRSVHERPTWPT